MMNKKYQVGIIGYGWAATAHIAAINATKNADGTLTAPSVSVGKDGLVPPM